MRAQLARILRWNGVPKIRNHAAAARPASPTGGGYTPTRGRGLPSARLRAG